MTSAPFGTMLTAMATAFHEDGSLDVEGTQRIAKHLVEHGHDGIVVSGTTGESPTTTVEEDGRILRAVREAVGPGVTLVAGVGTNDTRTTLELAAQAESNGADGLLLVTPYYNKPGQAGVLHHFKQVADATSAPIMLYDIPSRTGTKIAADSFREIASWGRIVAVKDAAGDPTQAVLLRELGFAVYSGDDALTLGFLAYGGCGVVSVLGHAAGNEIRAMITSFLAGDIATAQKINAQLQPALAAVMGVPNYGATTAKGALQLLGVLDNRTVRSPLVPLDEEEYAGLRAGLAASDLL
ncbi:4-hydroxy-tetrahydrodipicolinate synthase [Nocardioides sp.]|jgi:4-hydroxy-tetrahydrodipicolinate synthase|uniref:4-hydroxy-tetrahydrodipicolinate synthase n=1 Tax=Nocardioides sp. TaxID=35761 RepID=UPI002C08D5AE|nr:4-hydroxy-tetrahydrodipicolinate synthase [Nocardioides sp.]HVX55965.1 4-hydroxy-tetrahydrodipicolinate synthase [Nocardioides sp.]